MTPETVGLVACVGKKLPIPAEARDLYVSPWFVKARRYVESTCGRWFILSAEYGLLQPSQIVSPYGKTLNHMPSRERRAWAGRVLEGLRRELVPGSRVVFLAGERYREHLVGVLRQAGHDVTVPMEGMGIGRQLQWLDQEAHRWARRP